MKRRTFLGLFATVAASSVGATLVKPQSFESGIAGLDEEIEIPPAVVDVPEFVLSVVTVAEAVGHGCVVDAAGHAVCVLFAPVANMGVHTGLSTGVVREIAAPGPLRLESEVPMVAVVTLVTARDGGPIKGLNDLFDCRRRRNVILVSERPRHAHPA